jgi:hypothetical protein
MTPMDTEFALDGNAAAGLLQEFFACEVTAATLKCGTCGATHLVGASPVYALPMGAVVRCAGCQRVLIKAVKTPRGRWLRMMGAEYLRF